MKYEFAPELQKIAEDICSKLFPHIDIDRVRFIRSYGTSSRYVIARCHAIDKITQKALGIPAYYILEFLSERFDKLDKVEQIKVIIHELMHIPKSFGGGFRHHDHVTDRNVDKHYLAYKRIKDEEDKDRF
ncbi:MAG: metallopeptidase [Nanoarchaeota archaeon]|nr:metallopeptidase [Nanoarchaeota archaeon]